MPELTEFHSIMPIANIPSVLAHGILSHELAKQLRHASVAMQPVQEIRDNVQIPGGLKLHQSANLYFHARNPMMYKRRTEVSNLCVLRINTDVARLPGVVVTDGNASSTKYTRFYSPDQINRLPLGDIFAEDWSDPVLPVYYRQKSRKCAEILVPERVPPSFIIGAYVVSDETAASLAETGFSAQIQVDTHLFFR